jgi:hypothetical protein
MYQIISTIWFEKLYNKYGLYRIDRTHYCIVSCMKCSMYRNYIVAWTSREGEIIRIPIIGDFELKTDRSHNQSMLLI